MALRATSPDPKIIQNSKKPPIQTWLSKQHQQQEQAKPEQNRRNIKYQKPKKERLAKTKTRRSVWKGISNEQRKVRKLKKKKGRDEEKKKKNKKKKKTNKEKKKKKEKKKIQKEDNKN